jgi:hypothetical protein
MRRFIESFLDARATYLPLREPTLPTVPLDDPESQDYGDIDFGIDLNDPTILAQLDGEGNSFASIKNEEQGDFVNKVWNCIIFAIRYSRRS